MQSTTPSERLALVLGGTGKTGRRVLERLRSRGVPAHAASRASDPPFDWGYPFTGIQEATEIRSAVSVLGDTSVRTEGKGVRISEEGAGS